MKTPQKPLIISYLRFSSPEQMKGDSQRRQLELSARWASERGLTVTENLSDLGVSAFRGKNAREGALGTFLALVANGSIPIGSTLLVESLDRISRDEVRKAMQQFLAIIEAGITIVTLSDNKTYSPQNTEAMDLMMSLMIMARAYEESKMKSQRLSAAWENRRRAAEKGKIITKVVPFWLTLKDNKITVLADKAAIVKKIFRLTQEGWGLVKIAKELNGSKVKAPKGNVWHTAYLSSLLKDRSVLGELQNGKCLYENGKRKRLNVGEPIKGYYPQIISEDTFLSAQAASRSRQQTGGPNSNFVNLFQGLLLSTGSRMVIVDKGKNCHQRRYVSSSAKNGAGDDYVATPVETFETAVLMRIVDPLLFNPIEDDSSEITAQEERITNLKQKIEEVGDSILNGASSSSVVALLGKLDNRLKAETAAMEALQQKRDSKGNRFSDAGKDLIRLAADPLSREDEAKRLLLKQHLCTVVERIDCHIVRDGARSTICALHIVMKNGEELEHTFRSDYIGTFDGKPKYGFTIHIPQDEGTDRELADT